MRGVLRNPGNRSVTRRDLTLNVSATNSSGGREKTGGMVLLSTLNEVASPIEITPRYARGNRRGGEITFQGPPVGRADRRGSMRRAACWRRKGTKPAGFARAPAPA
jgi:hypothetical protein